jgi:hypothetical protein
MGGRIRRAGRVGAALAIVLGAGACGSTTPAEVASDPAPPTSVAADHPVVGATGAALRAALPGLYVPDEIEVSALAGGFALHSAATCAALRQLVVAGDWTVVDELGLAPDVVELLGFSVEPPLLLLANGDARAFAVLRTASEGCDARVAPAELGDVTVPGPDGDHHGAGWSATTSCVADDGELTVDVLVGLDDETAAASLHLTVDTAGESPGTVTASDIGANMAVGGHDRLLAVLSRLYTATAAAVGSGATDASDLVPADLIDGQSWMLGLDNEDDRVGSATMDAGSATPAGRVVLDGFTATPAVPTDGAGEDQADDDTVASIPAHVAFTFTCPTVTGLDVAGG